MPTFAELSEEFFNAEMADSPVHASRLGLTEYDDQLDDLSEAAFERRRQADATWLTRFGDVDLGALSFDDAIDRAPDVGRVVSGHERQERDAARRHTRAPRSFASRYCAKCSR